jgi:Protein of unknown function (DUF3426)
MFINCPYCRALVATDLATDLPPELCPQCKGPLRESHVQDIDTPATLSLSADGAATGAVDIEDLQIDATKQHAPSEHSASEHSRNASLDSGDAHSDDTHAAAAVSLFIENDTTTAAESTSSEQSVSDEDSATVDAIIATAPATSVAPVRTTMRRRAGQAIPSFARSQTAEAPRARAWPTIAAIVGLSGLLILQMLLADRARLAGDARWRPLLQTLCGALSCDLPPWREPAAFTLVQRDVRQHPTALGALRVTASFRNDARWSQPWPKLELTLSDVNGRPSGQRRFEAREYLGGTPAQSALASGETATVAMDIVEPAAQIVAYDVRFR